jgi:hypothetical protein
MQITDVHDYARQLLEARGLQAIVEAAQKARAFEEKRRATTSRRRPGGASKPR